MKKKLKPGPVPTLFNNFPPQKKQRRDNSTDRPYRGSSSPVFGCRALQFQRQPMGSYRKRKAARVRIADYLKLQCKCNPQITNVNLPCFFIKERRWTWGRQLYGILWIQCQRAWSNRWSSVVTLGTGGFVVIMLKEVWLCACTVG